MGRQVFVRVISVFLVVVGLSGFSVLDSVSLFKQLGGMDKVSQLAAELVTSSLKDPRLAGLVGGADPSLLTPKVADQICSMLGGGCKAPLTNSQISAAAKQMTPDQRAAVSDNFSSALGDVTSNSMVQQAVTKSIGSKIPGVLGGLL